MLGMLPSFCFSAAFDVYSHDCHVSIAVICCNHDGLSIPPGCLWCKVTLSKAKAAEWKSFLKAKAHCASSPKLWMSRFDFKRCSSRELHFVGEQRHKFQGGAQLIAW